MDGSAAAETIGVLVQNLINVSKDEISLIRGLKKNAQELQDRLVIIQSYLNDAEKKCIDSEAVQKWLKQLENVAFDADNVLDELNYHALHKKVNKTKTQKSCFPSFNHNEFGLMLRIKMAHKVKEITTKLDSIYKRAKKLRLESIVVNAPAATPAVFETDSFTLDPIFIGRDDDVPKLVGILTDRVEELQFSIVAVVGMGGMGKTTLTRKVFNHQRVRAQFGSLVWVHVSQTFDPIILFKKILASLTSQTESEKDSSEKLQKPLMAKTDEVESRDVILKKLHAILKAKTCLLVLDDIWNDDVHEWEDFVNSLYGVTSSKGNGIILTTRNEEVARNVKQIHIHPLNPLSNEECWSIIKAKTFEIEDSVPSRFEIIGSEIARRCQGLPLAANVLGGVLQSKSEEDEWHSVLHNWIPDNVKGVNNISKILRLSYDNLSSPSLKKCFMYCSIFPKGNRFEKQELIELWMAEGFLQPDDKNDMESVGNKYVNALLHNSLLLVASGDNYGYEEKYDSSGYEENYVTMHDLVHDLVHDLINSEGINRVRYLRCQKSSTIPKEVAKHLRTLLIEGDISGTMFSEFKSLHVLTCLRDKAKELPNSIRKLIHLRKLDISFCSHVTLPEWVGELLHLQTLIVDTGGIYSSKLPSTLKNLINLRHLRISNGVVQPAEIGRLTSLQTLPRFTVGDEEGYKIDELGSLKNLKGTLQINNLEKVRDKEEAMKANIFQKPNIFSLRFEWFLIREGDERNDESVLEGLLPHPNLKKIYLDGFQGKRLPLWFRKMEVQGEPRGSWIGLTNLTDISLFECHECEEFPALGHLTNLKSLKLIELRNVKSITSSSYDCKETITSVFPALERLELYGMRELREWAEIETRPHCQVKIFPRLRYLKISLCSPIVLSNIFQIKISSLTTFSIKGLDELECLPDWFFYNNHNLEELMIEKCPNLKWIGNPSGQGSLTSLRSLKIIECGELIDFPYAMVESLATSLQKLSLLGLTKTLPRVLDSLRKPKANANSSSEILSFRSLQELEIDVGNKDSVDAILQGCCHSLTELHLRGMEYLPESIQNLTVLSRLELKNFEVEELPEWLGNLSSLQSLTLSCKNLRRLPSVDAMHRLTNLRYIWIEDCSDELPIDPELLNFPDLSIVVVSHDRGCGIRQPSDLRWALEYIRNSG